MMTQFLYGYEIRIRFQSLFQLDCPATTSQRIRLLIMCENTYHLSSESDMILMTAGQKGIMEKRTGV